jgi:feruloyl esterase
MRITGWALSALGSLLATSAMAAPPARQAARVADRCTAMKNFKLAGIKITATFHVEAGATPAGSSAPLAAGLPAYCQVEGVINERIGFQGKPYGIRFALALPDDWSGRFLLQGGGGLNGSVKPPLGAGAAGNRSALARGFAVASHDSGHVGAVFDNAFMADQRASLDFSEAAVRVVAEAAKTMTAGYYGKAIAHSYMAGCSTGGRESMLAAQRSGIVRRDRRRRTRDAHRQFESRHVLGLGPVQPGGAARSARVTDRRPDLFGQRPQAVPRRATRPVRRA